MKLLHKRFGLLSLFIIMASIGCKSETVNPKYNPNEFILMVAASNDGEVGPCG